MKRLAPMLISLSIGAAGVACASAGANATGSKTKADANVITSAELSGQNFRNAYEAVQRLRPNWFTKKDQNAPTRMGMTVSAGSAVQGDAGSGLVVYLDNGRMGGPDALRDITIDGIGSIEYMDASTATAKLPGLGSSSVTGAIVVRSRIGN